MTRPDEPQNTALTPAPAAPSPVPATAPPSPLRALHERLGVRWTLRALGPDAAPLELPRNYGDPAGEYNAARTGAILVDRVDRALIRVFGRDPVRMVHGLVTNDVQSVAPGQAVYSGLLTPKGRLLADLRILRRVDDLLLETDIAAAVNVRTALTKYVPPLFARSASEAGKLAVMGVYGPAARRVLARVLEPEAESSPAAVPSPVDASAAELLPAGQREDAVTPARFRGQPLTLLCTRYAGVEGWDAIVACHLLEELWTALQQAGARPAGHATLDVLRIEAGRPRWGAELTEEVIPLEAGIQDRAISMTKGCYTGQEVIVRILHRGHVNRHLRGLRFPPVAQTPGAGSGDDSPPPAEASDAPSPAAGAALYRPPEAKPVGTITSACDSPLAGQTIALGYVRREVEPGTTVGVGAPEGPGAVVVALPFAF